MCIIFILCHVYLAGWLLRDIYFAMEQKLDTLMEEVRQSKRKVDKKIAELKREVSTAQEKTFLDITKKMSSSSYQFKKKSHEHQYHFNSGLESTLDSVKAELGRKNLTAAEDKSTLRAAQGLLDEGLKSLMTRQKYIKIADQSEFGWATVRHYQDDPLASDSEDEKNLGRAEKEARRDAERQASKRRHGKQVSGSKRPRQGQGWTGRSQYK